jgi:D-arabinose 1-dehydrogenase-like Zn-dependent alcohol dehydrogenase
MIDTMRAERFYADSKTIAVEDIPIPEPGPGEVPDNVPLEQAAILADAVSTPFGAVVRTGQVGIGESVGVWGVGGVGTHIVQLARLVGAVPVIAIDIKPAVLDRALELGADHASVGGELFRTT